MRRLALMCIVVAFTLVVPGAGAFTETHSKALVSAQGDQPKGATAGETSHVIQFCPLITLRQRAGSLLDYPGRLLGGGPSVRFDQKQ